MNQLDSFEINFGISLRISNFMLYLPFMVCLQDVNQDRIIKNKLSTAQLIASDVVYIFYHENAKIEAEDFDEALAAYNELSDDRPMKIVAEFGKFAVVTAEARAYAEGVKFTCIAQATVYHGLAQRLLLKFYFMFRKQEHPFKVFESKESAIKWLKKF